jgi:DNA polymerase-3 subunit gamma/tau
MRDLMVVKSTGQKSELVILTEQQRQRAGQIVEKFDIAALIYNIATLEKLRWAVKNSDTSRALLEASLLRFALSEHFMNVDGLLSELKPGTQATIKKKVTPDVDNRTKANLQATDSKPPATSLKSQNIFGQADIRSIKDNWPNLLKVITTRLGASTAGLLGWAHPSRFEDGILTLEFGPSAQLQKGMCERNGRAEQIQSLLCEQLSIPVKIKFEIAAAEQIKEEKVPIRETTTSQRRNELMNDPAVKTVLLGLDATITNIEED